MVLLLDSTLCMIWSGIISPAFQSRVWIKHLYFSLLSSGLSRPDKKINNQLNISIKHSVLTWQQILLHKLRVRLGVGEESIVGFVLVDQVLSEEDS